MTMLMFAVQQCTHCGTDEKDWGDGSGKTPPFDCAQGRLSPKPREVGHPGQWLLLIFLLAFGVVGVVVLNAGLNVIDRLLGEVQSLGAVPALVSSRFLQFFRGLPQMLKSRLHVRLVLWRVLILSVE